jgi:hypothetical protein
LYAGRKPWAIARYMSLHMASQVVKILALEEDRLAKIRAILRGAWDGYHGRIHLPY